MHQRKCYSHDSFFFFGGTLDFCSEIIQQVLKDYFTYIISCYIELHNLITAAVWKNQGHRKTMVYLTIYSHRSASRVDSKILCSLSQYNFFHNILTVLLFCDVFFIVRRIFTDRCIFIVRCIYMWNVFLLSDIFSL